MSTCRWKRPRALAYRRWYGMILRCTDPNHVGWKNYGARGIKVCPEWASSFQAYYDYVGDCPAPGLTVDRIDNDGNYEPGNVRWATKQEQRVNQRSLPNSHARKTHCPQGHPYDEANTYRDKRGRRFCRACNNETSRVRKERTRAMSALGLA